MKAAGITIVVIAISQWVKRIEILQMASDPSARNAIFVVNFAQLNNANQRLRAIISNGELPQYSLKKLIHVDGFACTSSDTHTMLCEVLTVTYKWYDQMPIHVLASP